MVQNAIQLEEAQPQSGNRAIPLILVLAFRNLFHDRIRLVATIVGIVFSIVLVTVQLGLYLGAERMITVMVDHARSDLWIVPLYTKSFEDSSIIDGHDRYQALATPGVAAVIPVVVGFAQWKRPIGGVTPIVVIGTNSDDEGLRPWNLVDGNLDDLSKQDAVAVDRSYFKSLGIERLGDTAEILHQKVRVVAVTRNIRSFTTSPYVFMSLSRARAFTGAAVSEATYFLVRVSRGTKVESVRTALTGIFSDAEVLTPAQFRSRSIARWLFGTGAGAGLIGGALLGIVVGTVIVAQMLYSSTKDHINEFATLRAIGAASWYIHKVILCQAILSAVISFSIAVAIGLLVAKASADTALPIIITPKLILGLFVLTVAMCALSAISAILEITRIDPAVVFRR